MHFSLIEYKNCTDSFTVNDRVVTDNSRKRHLKYKKGVWPLVVSLEKWDKRIESGMEEDEERQTEKSKHLN